MSEHAKKPPKREAPPSPREARPPHGPRPSRRRQLGRQAAYALLTSVALSLAFWMAFGVSQPLGFTLWTLASAGVGVGLSAPFSVRVAPSIALTALVRSGIFVAMTQLA